VKKALAAAGIITLAAIAQAQAAQTQERWPRWYVGLSGGLTFLADSDISGASSGSLEFDAGFGGNVALGYQPAIAMQPFSSMRFEVEGGYHSNSLDTSTIGAVTTNGSGNMSAWTYMANAYYDFRNSTGWTPYVGAGAGMADVHLSRSSGAGNTDSEDNVFAWQLMAGMAYSPANTPLIDWVLGYRFLDTNDANFNTATSRIEAEYQSHSVEAGMRLRF